MFTPVQEMYDISNYAAVRLATPDPSNKPLRNKFVYQLLNFNGKIVYSERYPTNTRGYFYFHKDENRPPISSEVRFRVCESSSAFAQGHDLLDYSGFEPWNVPLYRIAKFKDFAGIRHLLIKENLVDPDIISDLAQLPFDKRLTTAIYEIGEPFTIDLSARVKMLTMVTRKTLQTQNLTHVFSEIVDYKKRVPFAGKVRMRLVRSPFPEDADKDNPAFLMQCLKYLTPFQCVIPDYDYRIRKPEVGEYLHRKDLRTGEYRPWKLALKRQRYPQRFADFWGIDL